MAANLALGHRARLIGTALVEIAPRRDLRTGPSGARFHGAKGFSDLTRTILPVEVRFPAPIASQRARQRRGYRPRPVAPP